MFDTFEHSKSVVFPAQFLVGLVDSQVSSSSVVMGISKDFVTQRSRNNKLAKQMTSFSLARIPKMAENSIIEVDIFANGMREIASALPLNVPGQ